MLIRLPQSPFLAAVLLCVGCSSSPQTHSKAVVDPAVSGSESTSIGDVSAPNSTSAEGSTREVKDFFAPKPWTGAFTETAVMLADTLRIEGPEGLLDHVAAASDDEYYERTAEVTKEGFLQTITRLGPDSPEIRVRIDRWTLAATQRVMILESRNASQVTVIAGGNALWRDVNGSVAQADRLEFIGEIGQNAPVRPAGMIDATAVQSGVPAGTTVPAQGLGLDEKDSEDGGSYDDPPNDDSSGAAPEMAPSSHPAGAPSQDPSTGSSAGSSTGALRDA